jgi:hypothetical protein
MARSQHRRSDPVWRPALRAPTGLAITAIGAIFLLAVHVRADGVDLPLAGLILVSTGLAWLWLPVRDKRALLARCVRPVRRGADGVVGFLEWDPAGGRRPDCSLRELLGHDPTWPAPSAAPAPSGGPPAIDEQHPFSPI